MLPGILGLLTGGPLLLVKREEVIPVAGVEATKGAQHALLVIGVAFACKLLAVALHSAQGFADFSSFFAACFCLPLENSLRGRFRLGAQKETRAG